MLLFLITRNKLSSENVISMNLFHWLQAVAWVTALSHALEWPTGRLLGGVTVGQRGALGSVLSAFERLFRQLVSRRTVQLSSYQLLTPFLPSSIPLSLRLLSFSLSPFVHWPVSWRLSDGCGWRMEVSQERSLMNALYTKGPMSNHWTPPPMSKSSFQVCLSLLSTHFWKLHQQLMGGGEEWLCVEPDPCQLLTKLDCWQE